MADISLVLAGGIGLGAYQAGAYARLRQSNDLNVSRIAGSSIGAVNAALIAGGDPESSIRRLEAFWSDGSAESLTSPRFQNSHLQNWMNALTTRIVGTHNLFRPRLWPSPLSGFESIYDLSPLRMRLAELIDFDRLNAGDCRVSVAATDIETGDLVIFDSASERILMDHLLASCGYLPEFAPVEIGGRLLGDGGLSANAPFEAVLAPPGEISHGATFVLDLFSRDAERPESLEEALARKNDLLFGNQTYRALKAYAATGRLGEVFYLSYRAPKHEAGAEKTFDLSRGTINERWTEGSLDMEWAIRRRSSTKADGRPEITLVRRSGVLAEPDPARKYLGAAHNSVRSKSADEGV